MSPAHLKAIREAAKLHRQLWAVAYNFAPTDDYGFAAVSFDWPARPPSLWKPYRPFDHARA